MRNVIYLLLLLIVVVGCKSSKSVVTTPALQPVRYLSSKLQLTLPVTSGSMTTYGTMRMKGGERIQLSILMPILRTEIVRLEVTPDEVLLIDRMNKRYVRARRSEVDNLLPKDAKLSKLEQLLFDASLPSGRSEVSGKELGIPSLEKAKIHLYDFVTDEFLMTPTEVSDKYAQVPLSELLNMLYHL